MGGRRTKPRARQLANGQVGGTTSKTPDTSTTYTGFNLTSVWTINAGTSRPYLQNLTPQTPPN
jgi:hypothetical protein